MESLAPDDGEKKIRKGAFFSHAEAGAGMVQAIVAIALLGVGLVFVVRTSVDSMRKRAQLEARTERTGFKKYILQSTSCVHTAACTNTGLIELKDHKDQTLLAADGKTKLGRWTVRARCMPDKSIIVQAAILNGQGVPLRSLLDSTTMGWDEEATTLLVSGTLCGIRDGAAPAPTTTVMYGPLCDARAGGGSCQAPKEAMVDLINPISRMCCEDGRDAARPTCPSGKRERMAVWDRQRDWGVSGQWVVQCE